MYNLNFISRHATPSVGYVDQVTGISYLTQEEAIIAQNAVFAEQDTVDEVWTPRLQLSLQDRKALNDA